MKRKLLMLFLSAFLLTMNLMAQQITITGKVTSADDKLGIPGVSVRVKGEPTVFSPIRMELIPSVQKLEKYSYSLTSDLFLKKEQLVTRKRSTLS